jgi:hypothetical protein
MTIDEVADNVGAGVVYEPRDDVREDGVITSVSASYVFVRYRGDDGSKATCASDLTLLRQS